MFCIPVYSQSYIFRGVSGTEGLSDLVISTLYKDSCGYVWMGTATSVERFDGVHLKHYPIYASSERWKWVNAIIETSGNQLWVGTDGGFWQIGQDSLRWLIEHGKAEQITVRIPLIPQYNMEEDTTHSIALLKSMGLSHFDVFTYRT